MHYIIMCKSLTFAQRAERALRSSGIFASVTKAPQSANPGGCTYGVKVGERNLSAALQYMEEAGVGGGKLFALKPDGTVYEVDR